LQVWKKTQQEQQHASMDNALAQVGVLLSTVAELVRRTNAAIPISRRHHVFVSILFKPGEWSPRCNAVFVAQSLLFAFRTNSMDCPFTPRLRQACSTCSTGASVLSEASPSSYMYYFLPSPSSSELFYLKAWWITVVDSGLCYTICITRWGSILLATFLVHSLLRFFSAPMSVHNGVNLLGAFWLYMSSTPSSSSLAGAATSDELSIKTSLSFMHWQWLVLAASISSLFGIVQFQYWQGQSHIERKWKTLPNDDHDHHLMVRQTMKQMNQFYQRLQFLRLVLIVTYVLSWWWWFKDPDESESSTNPWYPALPSLPTGKL
jgi:hypothetical protein